MKLDLKNEFDTLEEGTTYQVPNYEVVDGEGIRLTGTAQKIQFVRGSKEGEGVEKRIGTLHEHLLSMMIADLKHKNSLVPSREGSLIITKLEEAYLWMVARQIDRASRGVQGTYKR